MSLFAGKRAIVTGASRGIGLSVSQKLAELGAAITLVARNEDLIRENVKLLATNDQQTHDYVPYNLLDLVQGKEPENHESLLSAFDRSSILINCAGVTTNKLLVRSKDADINATISTNLIAPIILSRLAIKPFTKIGKQQEEKPTIVNIASVLSLTGFHNPGTVVYAALKAGLLGFTESLAGELKGSIRVNSVLPALVEETDMGKQAPVGNSFPKVHMNEVVDKIVEAVSDESMNGKHLFADGKGLRFLGD